MPLQYDFITFDCYGTLIDWEGGIGGAFLKQAAEGGISLDREAVLALFAKHEPIVQAEEYRSYRDVLAETALRVAGEMGWFLSPRDSVFLADSLPEWVALPDTVSALARLSRASHRLGILSNVDKDLLAETLKHLRTEFDLIITAEDVRSYKPARAHFLEARRRIGDATWLHAAQSYFHDVIPARSLGIPTAWVNRKVEMSPDGGRPSIEVHTLAELAEAIA